MTMSNLSTSQSINVKAQSEYLADQSNPEAERYVFAYHVVISNDGEEPAKLVSRHWLITDGNNNVEEVKGDGVVGEQPWIAPGESFEYSSGAILKTPFGFMQGSYQMVTEEGSSFDAQIPPFTLARPNAIN